MTDDGDVPYESNFEGSTSNAGDDVVNGGCDPDGIDEAAFAAIVAEGETR